MQNKTLLIDMSKMIKLHTLNICSLLYVSYTLLKQLKQNQTKTKQNRKIHPVYDEVGRW